MCKQQQAEPAQAYLSKYSVNTDCIKLLAALLAFSSRREINIEVVTEKLHQGPAIASTLTYQYRPIYG